MWDVVKDGGSAPRVFFYPLAICLVVACIALLFHLTHGWRQARRFGARSELSADEAANARVSGLAVQMGVVRPRLLIDNNPMNFDAIVYGSRQLPVLALGRGLVRLARRDDEKSKSAFDVQVAHELAHIRNGDVRWVFIQDGLYKAAVLLLIAQFLWWIYQVYVYAGNAVSQHARATNSEQSILTMPTEFYESFAGYLFINTSIMIITSGLALVVIGFGARSFLRAREFCADLAATDAVGDKAFLDRIADSVAHEPERRSLAWVFLMGFSAHPTNSQRVKIVNGRPLALKPTKPELLWLGYAVGLSFFVLHSTVNLSNIFGGSSDQHLYVLILGPFLAFWLTVICLVAVRWAISTILLGGRMSELVVGAAMNALVVAGGMILGVTLNPARVANVLQFGYIGNMFLLDHLNGAIVLAISAFVLMLALTLVSYFTLHGDRIRPIRSWHWVLVSYLSFVCINSTGFFLLSPFIVLGQSVDRRSFEIGAGIAAVLSGAALLALIRRLCRNPGRISRRSEQSYAPWVYAESF
jgi:hypothetical protein